MQNLITISFNQFLSDLRQSRIDKAKLIAELIPDLSHEELTALSYLMYCQKDKIEKETRARLKGKSV